MCSHAHRAIAFLMMPGCNIASFSVCGASLFLLESLRRLPAKHCSFFQEASLCLAGRSTSSFVSIAIRSSSVKYWGNNDEINCCQKSSIFVRFCCTYLLIVLCPSYPQLVVLCPLILTENAAKVITVIPVGEVSQPSAQRGRICSSSRRFRSSASSPSVIAQRSNSPAKASRPS
jgi:hypothetical protein